MDRNALKLPFTVDRSPDWGCPTCQKGILRIKENSFIKTEIRRSRDHSPDDWNPEWIEYVYSCWLICTNDQCQEIVVNSGIGSVEHIYDGTYQSFEEYFQEIFTPKFFEPHLVLIDILKNCPKTVTKALNESFRLFFASPSAAVNQVRIAMEVLLTELGIKRFQRKTGKQQKLLSLHHRIELIPSKYVHLKELLLATKWIGNAGSHGNHSDDPINMDDVMDAYELIEHILQEIYAPKAKKLEALAKQVNKKKRPVN